MNKTTRETVGPAAKGIIGHDSSCGIAVPSHFLSNSRETPIVMHYEGPVRTRQVPGEKRDVRRQRPRSIGKGFLEKYGFARVLIQKRSGVKRVAVTTQPIRASPLRNVNLDSRVVIGRQSVPDIMGGGSQRPTIDHSGE